MFPFRGKTLVGPGGAAISIPKVVLAFAAGGSTMFPFQISRERLFLYELSKDPALRLLDLTALPSISGLYIANNRNLIAREFLRTKAEWLLQIDTDIEFPMTLLETMVDLAGRDKKILAASVPLGTAAIFGNSESGAGYRNGFPTCGFMSGGAPGVWKSVESVTETPLEVDGVATACILIHRDVLTEIARRGGQCWFDHIYEPKGAPIGDDWSTVESISLGEDIAFCVRARLAGFPSYVVHVQGLRHHKVAPQTHDLHIEQPEPAEAAI